MNGLYGLVNNDHGGHCCGIQHVHTFLTGYGQLASSTKEDRVDWIKKAIDNAAACANDTAEYDDEEFPFAIEVVLTTHQCGEWRESLEECGFKEVFSFRNGNSENVCHVFFYGANQ